MPAFGLLTYKAHPEYNVGDYIQSLAAARFLPQVDQYVNREKLSKYNGEKLKLILNGWFMHHPENWPPSEQIDPLLISFHLNAQAREAMLSDAGTRWFKEHGPVGCRDLYTQEALNSVGIDTWLSGCLTTTLKNKWNYRTNDIYFVDVLFRVPDWKTMGRSTRGFARSLLSGDWLKGSQRETLMKRLFTEDILKTARQLTHYHPSRHTEQERFEMAESFLEKYATARLVITSRLHCALPCLAFGTPVIFVEAGFNQEQEWCRLNGITQNFNTITVQPDSSISSNFHFNGAVGADISIENPTAFRQYVPALEEKCYLFVNAVSEGV